MKKHAATAPATAKDAAPIRRESELGPELYTGTLFARDAHLSAPRGTAALGEQLALMRSLRDSVIADPAAATPELLAEVMCFQRKDGSFSLVTDYRIDGDCRVEYVYRPSYVCCQLLMAALLAGNATPGLHHALGAGLTFCTGRKLMGHGFDDLRQQLEDMADFVRAGLPRYLSSDLGVNPVFREMIAGILDSYEERLERCDTFGPWGEDHTLPIMDVLEQYGRGAQAQVFVYGTLMEGMPNAYLLDGCAYRGRGIIEDFGLYDLGAYPAVKHRQLPGKPKGGKAPEPARGLSFQVMGELRCVDAEQLRTLHRLEGKGELYDFERVTVKKEGFDQTSAYVYVYRGEVEASAQIPLQLQPYPRLRAMKSTHVWYACYGSNLLRERFMAYVAGGRCRHNGRRYPGCSDTTPPADECAVTIPYELYFGNESGSWGGSGAAFIDSSVLGETWGRAYLITREQYEEIRDVEGRGSSWYDQELELGELSGIPMVTFTNSGRRSANAPSSAYLQVMRQGLEEIMPRTEAAEYMEGLAGC